MQTVASNEAKNLATLLELNKALSGASDFKQSLNRVLDILEQRHGMHHGAITLRYGNSGLPIEISNNPAAEGRRAPHLPGESINRRVVESGKSVVLPRATRTPMLLSRAAPRKEPPQELSYICVPITIGRKTTGALGVSMKFRKDRDYDSVVQLLSVAACMIGQAAKVEHLTQVEPSPVPEETMQPRPPAPHVAEASVAAAKISLAEAVAAYERDLIQNALKISRGNRSKAARHLNTTDRILNYKVKRLRIDYRHYRK